MNGCRMGAVLWTHGNNDSVEQFDTLICQEMGLCQAVILLTGKTMGRWSCRRAVRHEPSLVALVGEDNKVDSRFHETENPRPRQVFTRTR